MVVTRESGCEVPAHPRHFKNGTRDDDDDDGGDQEEEEAILKVLMMLLPRLPQERRTWVEATCHHPTPIPFKQHHKRFSHPSWWGMGGLAGRLLRKLPFSSSLHITVLETVSSSWSPPPKVNDSSPNKGHLRETVL